jgi:hypothetical protein
LRNDLNYQIDLKLFKYILDICVLEKMSKIITSNIGRNFIRNLYSNKQTRINNFLIVNKYSTENINNEESSKSEKETSKLTEDQIKEKILSNAMKHVPNLGFSNDALSQGIKKLIFLKMLSID